MDASDATRVGNTLSTRIVAHDDGTLSITVPPILVEGIRLRLAHDYAVAAVRLTDALVGGIPELKYGEDRDPASVCPYIPIDAKRGAEIAQLQAALVAAHERLDRFGWEGEPDGLVLRSSREWWMQTACIEITEVASLITGTVEDRPHYDDPNEWAERVASRQAHLNEAGAFLKALRVL